MNAMHPTRRRFLQTSLSAAGASVAAVAWAGEPPQVTRPRATDGDERYEPDWDKRLTLTIGHEKGDLNGKDDKVIQAGVDYVARLGGGTVKILPGEYRLRNSIYLPSGIRVVGSGPESVITKIASEPLPISGDSDWYDQEITVKDPAGLQVGDGIVIITKSPSSGARQVIKRTLVARSGNRFKLSDGLRENVWLSAEPICAPQFPLFTSEYTSDVTIENITLDGNRENNMHLDGNYAGCIFIQDCNRYTFRGVEARNYNGDGISFQICHDVRVENCHSHDNADLGVHPGSGSQRPVIRGCTLERNTIGLFWCWGVKYGLAEENRIAENGNYGVSIGHNDTDNVMRHNEITGSGKVGILFRDDARGEDFWANRNVVEHNRILDSGDEEGIAIDVQGQTKDVTLAHNEIRETRMPAHRTGIRIGPEAARIELMENTIEGFAQSVVDERSA